MIWLRPTTLSAHVDDLRAPAIAAPPAPPRPSILWRLVRWWERATDRG